MLIPDLRQLPRSAVRLVLALGVVLSLSTACSGSNGSGGAPIPSREEGFSAFTELPKKIEGYLRASGSRAYDSCVKDLLAAWSMPAVGEPERCFFANTDDDADREMVVVLSIEESRLLGTNVVVFDRRTGTEEPYEAFESLPHIGSLLPDRATKRSILAAGDLTGDGKGELVLVSYACNNAVCRPSVYVRRSVVTSAGAWMDLGAPDLERGQLWGGHVTLEDATSDGKPEIVIEGITGSDSPPPGRPFRSVYSWNGTLFALSASSGP